MLGLKRSNKTESVDWTSLLSLLEDDDRRAATERIAPTEGRESFLSALRRIDSERASTLLASGRQLHTAVQLVDRPTVAVAGMLNSGKTSLVATFLSPHGRARTLRGTNNSQGTHRFVLWLPSAWKSDVELWGLLMGRIGDALGHPPEMLSEDVQEAHTQYNNREGGVDSLAVPLIATDPALDRAGIGLLDCPDIVSDEAFGLGSPEQRRRLLGRAATLCSAFLVVSSAESSRDSTLSDLLKVASDLMPGVPRLLAVNKVRPNQAPDEVCETFDSLARGHGIDTIYAAYDFEVPASRPFIPTNQLDLVTTSDDAEHQLPVFFSVSDSPDKNPPASIEDDRMMAALPTKLDRGLLFERFRLALENGLRAAVWDDGFLRIEEDADDSSRATADAQDCLLNASLEFFAHRDIGGDVTELRLHQSERIVRQLAEAFAATAPWYARWGVRLNASIQRVFGGVGGFIRQLTPTAAAEKAATEIKEKFRKGEYGGLLTPGRLLKSVQRYDGVRQLPHWADDDRWEEVCESVILRFERDNFTSLDPRRLDDELTQMWRNVPMRKKIAAGLTPLATLFATFGAALMTPVDMGTSALFAVTLSEFCAAAGLTTLSLYWAGGKSTANVGQQAARQQLADFHAVVCDSFGVARPSDALELTVAGRNEHLPQSQIIVRDAVGPSLPVYRIRDEFRQELQRHVPRT